MADKNQVIFQSNTVRQSYYLDTHTCVSYKVGPIKAKGPAGFLSLNAVYFLPTKNK